MYSNSKNPKKLKVPNADQHVVQQEFIADGNANGTATLEDILTVLSKLNTVLLYHPAITELK